MTGSNRRPPACKAGALPAELIPQVFLLIQTINKCAHLTINFSRKEVIQPQVPLLLPCYDFTPVTKHTVVTGPLAVSLATSGILRSHGVTGGVYKTRERIHRSMLICDY